VALLANYPINKTNFFITRGVQNEVLFFVRDLDRNSVNTATFQQVTINIVDPASSLLLMSRNLSVVDATTALYMLTILASETASWETGSLRWSISVTRLDGTVVMLWTDMNYGPNSTLEVRDGPIPTATVAMILNPANFVVNNNVAASGSLPGSAQLGYQNGLQTFTIYPLAFTGSLEIDGSLHSLPANDSDWFAVSTWSFVSASSLSVINVVGSYLWLRVRLPQIGTIGTINQILYKN
jgi:hypothetical protein